eukprot:COSAG06_NODE_26326_length_617_cov_0.859073_2_plen_51_part_01
MRAAGRCYGMQKVMADKTKKLSQADKMDLLPFMDALEKVRPPACPARGGRL